MNLPRSMVEAGARASWEAHWAEIPWDTVDELVKDDVRAATEAAIRAAIGCAEVVGDNTTGEDEVFWGKNGSTHTIRPGDTILILRADAGEGTNG